MSVESSNLIVNYLPSSITEFDLEDMFKPYGEIESTKIVRDQRIGVSMGFGFVNFTTHEAALAAIEGLNGTDLAENKKMKVSLARPAWKANIHSNMWEVHSF
jgi:polyadenylate-binding protein